jgi:hypothetical protein
LEDVVGAWRMRSPESMQHGPEEVEGKWRRREGDRRKKEKEEEEEKEK